MLDSNIVVAILAEAHEHHAASLALLAEPTRARFAVSAHSYSEAYSTLTRGGERAPFIKPSARGMFNGITGGHTRWHLLRAVYEGVAYGIRDCLDSIPTQVDTVRMAGGGANSPVWAQIFADVLGRKVVVPAGSEFGAKGAAIVAGVGLGVFDSYEAGVDATVEIVREYEPDRNKTAVYDDFFGVYREIRQAVQGSWDKLSAATRKAAAL